MTLNWDNGDGLVFTRTISIDHNYMFTRGRRGEEHRLGAGQPVALRLISRTGTPQCRPGYYILHEGLIGELGGSLHEVKYASLSPEKPDDYSSTGGWLGFTDKYWLTALVPRQHEAIKAKFHACRRGRRRPLPDRLSPAPRSRSRRTAPAATSTRFFAGAKEVNLLDGYAPPASRCSTTRSISAGSGFLTKPIFLVLQFFYGLIGNFGLAILLLTLIIKLLFFPLANKSYPAMSKMKLLQPEMKKIRERFPDDKASQQQEIMALYKKVGANPLAGCLPIVIQIPVFFSLYKVLFVTIEMRHAPFFGWIHDLSAPDPTSFANLFGLIPFTPPHILMIGAWPLIMGVTMFLQQKLNPQPVDPVQARDVHAAADRLHLHAVGVSGRAGHLLGLEQSPQHRPAMDDHASRGRGLSGASAAGDLFPPREIAPELLEAGRLLFARECRFIAGAADTAALPEEACPRSPFSAARMSANRAWSTR